MTSMIEQARQRKLDKEQARQREINLPSLREVERAHIEKVLEATQLNIRRACKVLRIDPRTLYRKLDTYAAEG